MSKNQTVCRKRIGRKIQPKQFESLEIICEFEDTIVWDDVEDRQKKLDKLTELALIDYKKTFGRVSESLGLEEKNVSVTHKTCGSVQHGSGTSDNLIKPKVTEEKVEDFFDGIE